MGSLLFRLFGCVVRFANTRPTIAKTGSVRPVVGSLRRQSAGERRPYRPVLAPRHGDRRLCGHGRRGFALRAQDARTAPHLPDDIRTATGLQDFVGTAPLNLVYVAHGERMQDISAEARRLYASVDTGFIGQNVYLFCASEGLATVFRGAVDYDKLGHTMKLGEGQFVTFAQTVGFPRA